MNIQLPNRPDDEPVCADCIHIAYTGRATAQCVREECSVPDRIKGRHSVYPEEARNKGHCGVSGKYFEPRPKPSWVDEHLGRLLFLSVMGAVVGFYVLKTFGVIG